MIRTALLTAVVVASAITSASAQPTPSSGMLLGIYAFPNQMGLRVTSTMPGYSAHGTLFPNDVLTRVTADGINIFETRSLAHFEYAKDQIGPNRQAALEVFRPGQGYIHLWVEFIPVGGGAGVAASKSAVKAQMWSPQQKPGAERLFQRGPKTGQPLPWNPNNSSGKPSPKTGKADPGSLFRKF